MTYDVLRTTTNNLGQAGQCSNCLVSSASATNPVTDSLSNSLQSYALNTYVVPNNLLMTLDNVNDTQVDFVTLLASGQNILYSNLTGCGLYRGQGAILTATNNHPNNYTILQSDCGDMLRGGLTGGYTWTLPSPANLTTGFYVYLGNQSSGNITITTATNFIGSGTNNTTSFTLASGNNALVIAANNTSPFWYVVLLPSTGGGGAPCTTTNTSLQYNNSGSLGCANLNQNADNTVNATKGITWAAPNVPSYNSGGTTTCDWSISNVCYVTASGGNTTVAFTNPHGSGLYILRLTNDTSVRTFTMPASALSYVVPLVASTFTEQIFQYDGTTNYQGLNYVSSETAWIARPTALRSAPTQSTCTGGGCLWTDSTDSDIEWYLAGGGAAFKMFLSGQDCNPVTGICLTRNGVNTVTSAAALTAHGVVLGEGLQTAAATAAGTAHQVFASGGASADGSFQDSRDVKVIPFAADPNATAAAAVSYAASAWTPAAPGSNVLKGSLQAIPSTGANLQFTIELPQDWDTSSQPYINVYWGSGANTSGTMIWTASSACVDVSTPGGASDDPSYNAESAFTTRTAANANRMWYVGGQFTAITSGNGCKALSTLNIKLAVSGTAASAINAYYAVVTIPTQPNPGQAN